MDSKPKLKVALVHDYLVQYGGAEKTLEAICELFPDAPVYTSLYEPKNMTELLNSKKIYATQNKWLIKLSKYLTFLMPLAFESFDLTKYDLIVSDGTAWAKSVLTKPTQLHISYIHTPPRFLYGYSVESQKRNKFYFKPFVFFIDYFLRIWDFYAAQRPDYLIANSNEVKKRIKKFYNREATVIYPPVEIPDMTNKETSLKNEYGDYYLALGRLAAYKNFDFLINTFNKTNRKLVIAGTGSEEEKLKQIAGSNIIFLGKVTEEQKASLLSNCVALINPVEDEDLGIVPIEAMSYGKPVIVHKSGGHLETVNPNVSGMFFESLSSDTFLKTLEDFEEKLTKKTYNPSAVRESVQKYNKDRFKEELKEFIYKAWEQHSQNKF